MIVNLILTNAEYLFLTNVVYFIVAIWKYLLHLDHGNIFHKNYSSINNIMVTYNL